MLFLESWRFQHLRLPLIVLLCVRTTVVVQSLTAPASSHHNQQQQQQQPSNAATTVAAAVVQHVWNQQGVTSLAFHPTRSTSARLMAGTKRGSLYQFDWNFKTDSFDSDPTEIINSQQQSSTVPYPIYAMSSFGPTRIDDADDTDRGSMHQLLFCGSGDRYITVWHNKGKGTSEEEEEGWSVVQRLGPHTGWVKALVPVETPAIKLSASETKNQPLVGGVRLHSIGCNRIETWDIFQTESEQEQQQEMSPTSQWRHTRTTRSIESCPNQGSTLSSDLLCLAAWQDKLLSGGVDGRIHLWSSSPQQKMEPLQSIAAHQGRVNALATVALQQVSNDHNDNGGTSASSCLLVSAGHDGAVQCRLLVSSTSSSTTILQDDEPLASISLSEDDPFMATEMRITAMACVPITSDISSTTESVDIWVGTSTGRLVQLTLQPTTNDGDNNNANHHWTTCTLEKTEQWQIVTESNADNKSHIIHAIAILPESSSFPDSSSCGSSSRDKVVVVGHAKGLSLVSMKN